MGNKIVEAVRRPAFICRPVSEAFAKPLLFTTALAGDVVEEKWDLAVVLSNDKSKLLVAGASLREGIRGGCSNSPALAFVSTIVGAKTGMQPKLVRTTRNGLQTFDCEVHTTVSCIRLTTMEYQKSIYTEIFILYKRTFEALDCFSYRSRGGRYIRKGSVIPLTVSRLLGDSW